MIYESENEVSPPTKLFKFFKKIIIVKKSIFKNLKIIFVQLLNKTGSLAM